jgi:hypothetical protein
MSSSSSAAGASPTAPSFEETLSDLVVIDL